MSSMIRQSNGTSVLHRMAWTATVWVLAGGVWGLGGAAGQETLDALPTEAGIHPLSSKEEMIRDRFQRLQDRVYRLREQLGDREPQNAARLEHVLQRSGELGLSDRLDDLVNNYGTHRPAPPPWILRSVG